VVDPGAGERPQVLDQPARAVPPVAGQVEDADRRLLDLGVVAAHLLAVPPEHAELAVQVGREVARDDEQVAGIGVPGDQPQRLALAAADQDRRAR